MLSVNVKVWSKDKGAQRIFADMAKMDRERLAVKAGIVGASGKAPDTEIVKAAAANEFGTKDGHIPGRSFIRSTVRARSQEWGRMLHIGYRGILDGRLTGRKVLGLIGATMEGDIKATITAGGVPFTPNAPSTVAAKGEDKPLMDTRQMRAAVTHVVFGRAL